MRVKYFYQRRWPNQSPGVIFVTFNALGFYQNDTDFELITVANTKEPVHKVLLNQFGIEEKLPIHLLPAGPFRRFHWMVCAMGFFYLLPRNLDVLITRDLTFLPFALLLRRLKKCRVVFESHDFFTDLRLFPPEIAARRKKQSQQERRYCPQVDMIICLTEHQKLLYEQHYPFQRVVTAVSGIRPRPRVSRSRFQYTLGYIGTISSRNYDLELLISALGKTANPVVSLILAGVRTGEEEEYVNRLAEAFQVKNRIQLLPWLNQKEVDRLKERIDIGCCPLVHNKRNVICSPLKALEYLSAGIPVLYPDLQATDFIIKDNYNGFLIKNRPQAWAKTIDAIYRDFDHYQMLSNNCFQTAEQYSWEQRAKKLGRCFRESFLFSEK